jgi:hypothetical protein
LRKCASTSNLIGTRNKKKIYLKNLKRKRSAARTKKIQLQNVSFWSILTNGNQAIMKRAYKNDETKKMTASSESTPNFLEEAKNFLLLVKKRINQSLFWAKYAYSQLYKTFIGINLMTESCCCLSQNKLLYYIYVRRKLTDWLV